MSATVVRERSQELTRRIADLEDRIAHALGESPVVALASADDVRAAWEALPIRDRKRIVDILMSVTILPAGRGVRFSPEQVRVEWRTT
jgi:site-specific DNA recombinase